jgi:hypothetical protein|tara:strand:+ start:3365 stop:3607 length:243 start_codon:yes stop_codon:yes gene_type:complete
MSLSKKVIDHLEAAKKLLKNTENTKQLLKLKASLRDLLVFTRKAAPFGRDQKKAAPTSSIGTAVKKEDNKEGEEDSKEVE